MIRPRGWWWRLVPLAVIALLLLGIVNLWWGREPVETKSQSKDILNIPKIPATVARSPLSAYQVVIQKDLFSPSRQGEEGAAQGQAQANLNGGKLLGTIIIGPVKAALIAESPPTPSSKTHVIRPGERWGSFDIVEISDGLVVIKGKEGNKTMQLFEKSGSEQGGGNEELSEKDREE